jgi:D-glycero-D-manno-heptose 1,7-bisphosphate phosphatase
MSVPALFLDRDGVINVDHGYVHQIDRFEFMDGIFELCRLAQELGFYIFVVTNQAGIGRGYYTEEDFCSLTRWMCEVFKGEGVNIQKVYFCATHPEYGLGHYKTESVMRKPNPGMLLQAARDFNIDLSASVLIGDKGSDIAAGLSAGVRSNLLLATECQDRDLRIGACKVISRLQEAIPYLQLNSRP